MGKNDLSGSLKIYTNNVLIKNRRDHTSTYVVLKSETNNVPMKEVLVDGRSWSYKIANDTLSLAVEIQKQGVANIEIIYKEADTSELETTPLAEALKVSARRYFSEFRDNYICKNPTLLSLSEKTLRFFLSKYPRE